MFYEVSEMYNGQLIRLNARGVRRVWLRRERREETAAIYRLRRVTGGKGWKSRICGRILDPMPEVTRRNLARCVTLLFMKEYLANRDYPWQYSGARMWSSLRLWRWKATVSSVSRLSVPRLAKIERCCWWKNIWHDSCYNVNGHEVVKVEGCGTFCEAPFNTTGAELEECFIPWWKKIWQDFTAWGSEGERRRYLLWAASWRRGNNRRC